MDSVASLPCVPYPNATQQKVSLITALDRRLGLQEVEAPGISRQWAHDGGKVVSRRHLLPLPPTIKNPNDPLGNRTRDLPAVANAGIISRLGSYRFFQVSCEFIIHQSSQLLA